MDGHAHQHNDKTDSFRWRKLRVEAEAGRWRLKAMWHMHSDSYVYTSITVHNKLVKVSESTFKYARLRRVSRSSG